MKSYVAYVRVSTVKQGEHGSSLQEQRAAIEAYAARHQLAISAWYQEVETAAKLGRQVFNRMLKDVARKRVAGVIMHKIDRGARNLKDWARLGELTDQGLDIHFAHESLDLTTRGGRLAADIQAVVAADFIRNLRDETRKGFYGRLRQGFYPLPAPRGYLDCGRAKPKAIDPVEAPRIREAFELYATGEYTLNQLRREMQRRGLATKRGTMLSLHGIANILHNPFYVGIVRLRKTREEFAGNHEAIISTELYAKVQAILEGRVFSREPGDPLFFRRLIKCRGCGLSVIGERQKGHVYYRCHSSSCRGTSVRGSDVEALVLTNLASLRIEDKDLGEMRDHVDEHVVEAQADEAVRRERVTRDMALLDERMNRLTDLLLDGTLDRDTYNERKSALLWSKQKLEEILASGNRPTALEKLLENLEQGNGALNLYESGNSEERRRILKTLTSNLFVHGKELEFPMYSPFSEVREWTNSMRCDPYHPHARNSHTLSAPLAPIPWLDTQVAQMKPMTQDSGHEPPTAQTGRMEIQSRRENDAECFSRGEVTSEIQSGGIL